MFKKFECETCSRFWGDEKTASRSLWARLWVRASGEKCEIFPYLSSISIRVDGKDLVMRLFSHHAGEVFARNAEWMREVMIEWFGESGKEIKSFSIECPNMRIL